MALFWSYLAQFFLLTYSMVQSLSWEANWFAASQEIPRISRNPKVHYRTHKRPRPFSILGQPNPVHIPTSHLLEIHPNIILNFLILVSGSSVSPPNILRQLRVTFFKYAVKHLSKWHDNIIWTKI